MSLSTQATPSPDMFRPPINRAMRDLDRSFFKKKLEIAAACVLDRTKISAYQKKLSQDILRLERLPPVRSVPPHLGLEKTARCLLLKPEIRHGGESSSVLHVCVFAIFLTASGRRVLMESPASGAEEYPPSGCDTLPVGIELRLLELPYVFASFP